MRLVCLLFLVSAAASAQPADSPAARRPRVSSLSLSPAGVAFQLDADPGGRGRNLLAGSIDYQRTVGPAPVIAQVGASFSAELFGGDELVEAHVAVGASGSGGPVLFSATVGPSLARVRRSLSGDPDFLDGRAVTLPGLYASARAILVVVPKVGFGVEAFAHVDAKLPLAGGRLVFAFGRLPGALVPNPPPTPRRPGP